MRQWTAAAFEMHADQPVPAGIDGEAVQLAPPLQFRIRPGALRVRLAPDHPGTSPSALQPEKPWGLVRALGYIILRGAPPEQPERSADAVPLTRSEA
jgi:hypothetical protein